MNRSARPLWLAVMILTSVVVGAITAVLTWADSHSGYDAILTGGAAVGGSFLALLAGIHFAIGGPSRRS